MKARKKGTQEWKEYKEVFGPDHEFLGLETLGYWQSDEDYCKEHPKFPNGKTVETIKYLRSNYAERLEKHDFL